MNFHSILNGIFRRVGNRLLAMANEKNNPKPERDFRWTDPQNEEDAMLYLIKRLEFSAQRNGSSHIILVGGSDEVRGNLKQDLVEKLSVTSCPCPKLLTSLDGIDWANDVIGIASFHADEIHEIGKQLLNNPKTCGMTFEYAAIPKMENIGIDRMYENSQDFLSPLHLDKPNFNKLYSESCEIFEPKTGIRDFMDLLQGIKHVLSRNLPGDLAEFGSFKGQSGFLTARFLQNKGSNKKFYMFDAFESFPVESIGVDRFWSDTHEVDFEEIKQKFNPFKNVELVQGDFTETFPRSNCGKICLAFVDCDSYRGTQFLINQVFEDRFVEGGLMIFEDYGHASLLGNRLAIHESFEHRKNAFCFFSQFSGSFFVCKISK